MSQHMNPSHQAKLEAAKQFLGKSYVLHPEYEFDERHSPYKAEIVQQNRQVFESQKNDSMPVVEQEDDCCIHFNYIDKKDRKSRAFGVLEHLKDFPRDFLTVVVMTGWNAKEMLSLSKRKLPVFRGLTSKQINMIDKNHIVAMFMSPEMVITDKKQFEQSYKDVMVSN